jgi:predicted negative regulator of RcsB-dependent stress response
VEYITEEQQLDSIRQWFKKHGQKALTVVLVVAAMGLGVRYWFHHKEVVRLEASEKYMALVLNQSEDDEESAKLKAEALVKEFPETPYAALASFNLAKQAVDKGEFDEALKQLEWIGSNSSVKEFTLVAKVRGARILMNQKKYDDALKMLEVKDSDGYAPLVEELKGDIYSAKKLPQDAKTAYMAAYDALKSKEMDNPLLRFKLQELGENVPAIEPKEEVA